MTTSTPSRSNAAATLDRSGPRLTEETAASRAAPRRMSAKQAAWCNAYENATTFEPLMDDFLANNESFARAAKKSRDWFESWMNDAFRGIPDIPGERT